MKGDKLDSIIDSWGVDFVLLDKQGRCKVCNKHRDSRTDNVPEQVMREISHYRYFIKEPVFNFRNLMPYQVKAILNENPSWLPKVDKLLLIPDYLHYRLCGKFSCEYTNASTSQLLNAKNCDWDPELEKVIGVAANWLQPITGQHRDR